MTIRFGFGLAALGCSKVADLAFEEKEHFYIGKVMFSIKENEGCRRIVFCCAGLLPSYSPQAPDDITA